MKEQINTRPGIKEIALQTTAIATIIGGLLFGSLELKQEINEHKFKHGKPVNSLPQDYEKLVNQDEKVIKYEDNQYLGSYGSPVVDFFQKIDNEDPMPRGATIIENK